MNATEKLAIFKNKLTEEMTMESLTKLLMFEFEVEGEKYKFRPCEYEGMPGLEIHFPNGDLMQFSLENVKTLKQLMDYINLQIQNYCNGVFEEAKQD